MLAHSGGITLSRYLGESVALIEAPGVSDVAVRGQTNVMTDSAGYAVVPFVRPITKIVSPLMSSRSQERKLITSSERWYRRVTLSSRLNMIPGLAIRQ